VWVIDSQVRRHVVDPASLAAWHFDGPGGVVVTPAAQVYQYPQGADLPAMPFVFASPSDPKVYLLDVPLQPGSSGAGGDSTGGAGVGGGNAGGAGGAGGDAAGGSDAGTGGNHGSSKSSACAVSGGAEGSPLSLLLAALAMGALRRRRRG
jgi:MYXO-CTERM domain-containing protein